VNRQQLRTLDELAFIESAYAVLLGRAADPKGLSDCFHVLQDGASKAQILKKLQASDESKAFAAMRAGRASSPALTRLALLMAIRGDAAFVARCYLELTGRPPAVTESVDAVRALADGRSRQDLMRSLRQSLAGREHRAALEDVHVLDLTPEELSNGDRCKLDRLLSIPDEAFVHLAYRRLLGRDPDRPGRGNYLAALRLGTPRMQILHQLRESPEGRARGASIEGLPRRHALHSRLAALFYGAMRRTRSSAQGPPRGSEAVVTVRHEHTTPTSRRR